VKDRMTETREEEGESAEDWLVGTQTQYLWMFISLLVLREAHIFHLGIAGQQARSSSMDVKGLGDSLVTESHAQGHKAFSISICL